MIQVSVADRGGTRTFSFPGDEVIIGSAPDSDLVLRHRAVAPKHVRVARRHGRLYLDDLHGGEASRTVEPIDRLMIGGVELWVALRTLAPEGVVDELERRMLEDLRQRPDNAELRAVYADWLDDHGQAARAEFLRLQLAVAGAMTPSDPLFVRAVGRLRVLATAVGDGWRARVAMSFIEQCPKTFLRGLGMGFDLVCPARWDKLSTTAHEDIRSCAACRRQVTYCTSLEQASTAAQAGGCIAVDVLAGYAPFDLQAPHALGHANAPISHYGRR